MPVTARLPLKFYERLGEDVANELADLIKWTFVFVAGGTITVLGFLFTVLGRR